MGKIELPETVKVAKVYLAPSTTVLTYAKIPIEIGEDEVALLMAVKWISQNNVANVLTSWIWKRSYPNVDPRIPARFDEDSNVIDYEQYYRVIDTNVGAYEGSRTRYYVLPYPMVLIRSPQLVTQATVSGVSMVNLICWYVNQKVTDAQLAELMVKDHA